MLIFTHLVPWNGPEHLELAALDVEAEEVHGGVVQGEQQAGGLAKVMEEPYHQMKDFAN